MLMREWISAHFDLVGKWLPDDDRVYMADVVASCLVLTLLSCGQNRHSLYTVDFVQWCMARVDHDLGRVPGYKYFMRTMRELFPRVTWTNKDRFSQCTTCAHYNTLVRTSSGASPTCFP